MKIYAGDTAVIKDTLPSYLNLADCTVTLVLRGASLESAVCTVSDHSVKAVFTGEKTAAMTAGRYAKVYQIVGGDGARTSFPQGFVELLPDPSSTESNFDVLTDAQRALEECEAAIFKFTSSGGKVKSYTIGSRQMEFASISDLLALRDRLKMRVLTEGAQDGLDSTVRLVRFR